MKSEFNLAEEMLSEAGLTVNLYQDPVVLLQGGTSFSESSIGPVLKNAFSIEVDNGKWVVRLPGEGQLQIVRKFSDYVQAVKHVIDFYDNLL